MPDRAGGNTKMFGIRRKAAITITAAIFATALLGGAALAAFAPAQLETPLVQGLDATPSAQAVQRGRADKIRHILDALVAKNVITQAQEDAILAAVQGDRTGDELRRHVLAGLFGQSATYLGTSAADLKTALRGTSLGAIADKTAGKSRAGLVTALTTYANGAIDKAVADQKLTADQAAKARSNVPEKITRFVDHTYPAKTPRSVTPRAPKHAFAPRVHHFIGEAMSAARDYLGVTAADLAASLRSGKSLGEVAEATAGKTRTGLIAAIAASTTSKIDAALADGKLTADQATSLKAAVPSAVTALVDRKGRARATTP